jgi:hypothetical protein
MVTMSEEQNLKLQMNLSGVKTQDRKNNSSGIKISQVAKVFG